MRGANDRMITHAWLIAGLSRQDKLRPLGELLGEKKSGAALAQQLRAWARMHNARLAAKQN